MIDLPKKRNSLTFPIEVFWSDDDDEFVAIVHGLPGSSAWGKTRAEAITELEIAMSAGLNIAQTEVSDRSLKQSHDRHHNA